MFFPKSFFHPVGTLRQMLANLRFPEPQYLPAHSIQTLIHTVVTRYVTFYLGIPESLVGLDAMPILSPITAMPELTIHKHSHLTALETDVGRTRHAAHILAIPIAPAPQLVAQHLLGLGVARAVGLHATSTLFGGEMVGHERAIAWCRMQITSHPTCYVYFAIACCMARASWSGQEVPLPPQSIPWRRAITSSARIPSTSLATPWVLPPQPPKNLTLWTIPSSISKSIIALHVPVVMY